MAGDGRTPAQIAYDEALWHARQARSRFDVYLRSVQGRVNKRYPRARQLAAWRVLTLAVAKLQEHARDVNAGSDPLPVGEVSHEQRDTAGHLAGAGSGNESSTGRREDPAPGAVEPVRSGQRRRDPAVRPNASQMVSRRQRRPAQP